jgi:DNA invertase Pin-like site-specific DNA recombinase
MQAAGYVRNLQGSPHHTLYAQHEQLCLWARDANTPLVAVFQGEATTEDRPGLRTLWASLDKFDVVVVESLDVFSANIITQELIVERLERAGISAVVTDVV